MNKLRVRSQIQKKKPSMDDGDNSHPELMKKNGRKDSGVSDSSRVTWVRHPEIPSIAEEEVLSFKAISRPSNRSLEELYDVVPGYLEIVAPEPSTPPTSSFFCQKRDRSLSLPAVHGNFRLLRPAIEPNNR